VKHNVFQLKPAFNVSVHGGLSILPYRLALAGNRTAPPGSAKDLRSMDGALRRKKERINSENPPSRVDQGV